MKDKIVKTIDAHNMLKCGDKVLLALSGGIDSTVMACIFNELRVKYDLSLYVFHLNHKLRPGEAEAESEFVKELSLRFRLKPFIREFDVKEYADKKKLSIQVAAREIRYKLIDAVMKEHKIDKAATAHNADDRAETVLLRLIRGTAGANVAGIPPVRDGYIVRPLIDVTRAEIEEYASCNGIEYMTDSSNLKTDYLRNKVRLELIPFLKDNYNEQIVKSLVNFSKTALLENKFIKENVKVKYEESLTENDDTTISFSVARLRATDEALVNRIITTAFYTLAQGGEGLSFEHVEKLKYFINSEKPNLTYDLPGNITAVKSYEKLMLTSSDLLTCPEYEYAHELGGATAIDETGITLTSELVEGDIISTLNEKAPEEEYLDAAALTFPVTVRNFRAGDLIRPLNMTGRKKLKDIFIDKKLTKRVRQTVPILLSNGGVVLVHGVCVSDGYKVTATTKSAVRFTVS